jgi:hypothetical protein
MENMLVFYGYRYLSTAPIHKYPTCDHYVAPINCRTSETQATTNWCPKNISDLVLNPPSFPYRLYDWIPLCPYHGQDQERDQGERCVLVLIGWLTFIVIFLYFKLEFPARRFCRKKTQEDNWLAVFHIFIYFTRIRRQAGSVKKMKKCIFYKQCWGSGSTGSACFWLPGSGSVCRGPKPAPNPSLFL